MNIDQLLYFSEAYRQKSMTKASKNLYISTPSLCSSIKNLENELGTVLFNRTTSGIEPTLSGKLFYMTAQNIITELTDYSLSIAPVTNKEINIVTFRAFSHRVTQQIYQVLSQNFPDYFFNFKTMPYIRDLNDIALQMNKTVDIYIFLSENTSLDKIKKIYNVSEEYKCKQLGKVATKVIMSNKHPFKKYEVIPRNKLLDYPIVFHTAKASESEALNYLSALTNNKVDMKNIYFIENEDIYYDYLKNKQALSFVYDEDEIVDMPLIYRQLDVSLSSYLYIVYHSGTSEIFYSIIADSLLT